MRNQKNGFSWIYELHDPPVSLAGWLRMTVAFRDSHTQRNPGLMAFGSRRAHRPHLQGGLNEKTARPSPRHSPNPGPGPVAAVCLGLFQVLDLLVIVLLRDLRFFVFFVWAAFEVVDLLDCYYFCCGICVFVCWISGIV